MEEQISTRPIIIDEEFKHLMPPLGKEAYASLEAGLLKDGCLNALVLWEGILIDGHNRYEICTKHSIPFETIDMDFPSRDAVHLWIIETQMGRRNLSPIQLTYFRGVHYRMEKKVLVGGHWQNPHSNSGYQNDNLPQVQKTSANLGSRYQVSQATILRDAKASEGIDAIGEVSGDAKTKILASEVKLDKKALAELAGASEDEIAELARTIEDGTYAKPASARLTLTNDKVGNHGESGFPAGTSTPPGNIVVDGLTGEHYKQALNAAKGGESSLIRKTLRAYIDMLESVLVQV